MVPHIRMDSRCTILGVHGMILWTLGGPCDWAQLCTDRHRSVSDYPNVPDLMGVGHLHPSAAKPVLPSRFFSESEDVKK